MLSVSQIATLNSNRISLNSLIEILGISSLRLKFLKFKSCSAFSFYVVVVSVFVLFEVGSHLGNVGPHTRYEVKDDSEFHFFIESDDGITSTHYQVQTVFSIQKRRK